MKTCDACGKSVAEGQRTSSVMYGFLEAEDGELVNDATGTELELCPQCTAKLTRFLCSLNQ